MDVIIPEDRSFHREPGQYTIETILRVLIIISVKNLKIQHWPLWADLPKEEESLEDLF